MDCPKENNQYQISTLGIVSLHLLQAIYPNPDDRWPHIYLYLFAIYAFGHFFLALMYCSFWQWTLQEENVDVKKKEE